MTNIRIFKSNNSWIAQSDDPEVKRLFGTDMIPTAFTERAPASVVLAELRRLNPDATVELA